MCVIFKCISLHMMGHCPASGVALPNSQTGLKGHFNNKVNPSEGLKHILKPGVQLVSTIKLSQFINFFIRAYVLR